MCVYVRVHANVLGIYLQNCANAQASHMKPDFCCESNDIMKVASVLYITCLFNFQSSLWQSDITCLCLSVVWGCVTWESESEGGSMKFYWQWENVRVYRGIALVCVYTTYMAFSMSTCLPHVYVSTHLHMSTLHPHVYSTSICRLHLYMSTTPPYVYSTSTCIPISISIPHFHMYTPPLHVYPTPHAYSVYTCLLYIHMSTPSLRVYHALHI